MNSKQVHVIINPVAGNGKGKVVGNEFSGLLLKKGLKDFNIHFTRFSQDATQITGESIDAGAKLIIAIGGDGTIHEVINGFFNGRGIRNPECELGIINCGTGCGLANSLKLPKSLDSQIDVILSGNTGYLDTGRISYFNDQGEQVSRMFVSECQVGIGSLVASRVGKLQKKIGGKLGFGISAVIQAIIMKAPRIEITFDKKNVISNRFIGIVIGNGSECAGGMQLTPDANAEDGYFDVLLIYNMPILRRLISMGKVYSGDHIRLNNFKIVRCKTISIASEPIFRFEADGEMIGKTPFTIEIVEQSIKTLLPAK